jgi:hypothetical protein
MKKLIQGYRLSSIHSITFCGKSYWIVSVSYKDKKVIAEKWGSSKTIELDFDDFSINLNA